MFSSCSTLLQATIGCITSPLFTSCSFAGAALNKAVFLPRKGSECAIVDTPLSSRYSPPPQIALNCFEWYIVEGVKFEPLKTAHQSMMLASQRPALCVPQL